MRIVPLLAVATTAFATSCYQFQVTAQGGYTQMKVGGDIALAPSGSGNAATVNQSVHDAFGLGAAEGSPYARLQFDFGVPVLTASGFLFSEDGTGTLQAQYGGINAGSQVFTSLDFKNAKVSYAFKIDFGPVKVSPGVAVDIFDLNVHVRDVAGFASEDLDVLAPVPMGFLRLELDLGTVGFVGEGGYVTTPKVQDAKGTFWDAEGMLEVRPTKWFNLFGGYRYMDIEGSGNVDNQAFDTKLHVAGWFVGGGFRF